MWTMDNVRLVVRKAGGMSAWGWFASFLGMVVMYPVLLVMEYQDPRFCDNWRGTTMLFVGAPALIFVGVVLVGLSACPRLGALRTICRTLPIHDGKLKDVVVEMVHKHLMGLVRDIQALERTGTVSSRKHISGIKERELRPYYDAALRLGLLRPEVRDKGYKGLFESPI